MSESLTVWRRRPRPRPMRSRRVGATPVGAPETAFPGIATTAPQAGGRTLLSGGAALLLHGGLIGLLLLAAAMAPEVEELIEDIEFIRPPDAPDEPAPAPRVIAESFARFDPGVQSVAPQIVNPTVTARAVPSLTAQKIEVADVAPVRAPEVVARADVSVEKVTAFRSVAVAPTAPVPVDLGAPAIRGPIDLKAPLGPSVGPRAIAAPGETMGTGPVTALGTGSSVREGLATGRDVHGAASGPRLANVHTRVGDSFLSAGPGGHGTGPGGVSFEDCLSRPDVKRYMAQIRKRVYERWILPEDVPPDQQVELRFKIDPSGSTSRVEVENAQDPLLGKSAVAALRAASPFPPMPETVRCLAGRLKGTFRNPGSGSKATVAN